MAKGRTNGTTPEIVVEGLEDIIERDRLKHLQLRDRTHQELQAFRAARSHEIKKKKFYVAHQDDKKYDKRAMRRAIKDINTNIRHWSDKCSQSDEKLAHHTLIVDTLTKQLAEQNMSLKRLAAWRREHGLQS